MRWITRAVAVALVATGWAGAQVPEAGDLEALKALVVKLTIHRPRQSDETAAGVFVGRDQKYAYFVTACHAVIERCKDVPGTPVESIQLRFRALPQPFEASVFTSFDPVLDLAVVQSAAANLPTGLPMPIAQNVKVGARIHIIGHPVAGSWSVWSGTVQNENGSNADVKRFTTNRDLSLAGGYSGGPVFDSQGALLGFHSETTVNAGIAIKSQDVLRQLAGWQIPTTGIAKPGQDATGDREAIERVLTLYQKAFTGKDAGLLWSIWPNPPADVRRTTERFFESAKRITLTLHAVTPERLTSDQAVVSAKFSMTFEPQKGGAPLQQDGDYLFTLRKANGVWAILSRK